MKTQRKYSRVHKKRALTHKKRKLSKKTLKRKNKKRVKSRRRKSRKHKKRGGTLKTLPYGVGSSLDDFPSADKKEVYGFKIWCPPGYQAETKSAGDGTKDEIYTERCVLDDRQLELGIQDEELAKNLEDDGSYGDFANAAGSDVQPLYY